MQTAPMAPLDEFGPFTGYQLRISAVLCLFTLLLGAFTAITTARIVVRTYSPVMYWDQWEIVDNLMRSGGHITLSQLWAQHNEHRIPVGHLAGYADLRFFSGRNVSLLIEIYLLQLFHVLIFAWMIRRTASFSPAAAWTALGLVLFCMFSPIQMENFYWGFQIVFVMAGFSASVAFVCAIWYSEVAVRVRRRFAAVPLLLCILAALVSEFSLSNGVLVWPILSLLALYLRWPRRAQWLLAGVGVLAIAAYMIGYRSPAYHSNPLSTVLHPLLVARYVVTYFASTWDPNLPNASPWPVVSESLTILSLAIAVLGAFRFFRRRSEAGRLEAFLFSNIIFTVATALATAMGRATLGTGQAMASRYQTIALVFWASLGVLLLSWCAQSAGRRPWLIQVQAVIFVLVIAAASRFNTYEGVAKAHQASLATGYAALVEGASDQEDLKLLYPVPQRLPAWYAYLQMRSIGPDVHHFGRSAPSKVQPNVGTASPHIRGYQLVPSSRCSGYLDSAKPVPGVQGSFAMGGWAWDIDAKKAPVKVVIATSDGRVAGVADLGFSRPDVPRAATQIKGENTGWNGLVQLPAGALVRAFAVLADMNSACPLMNEYHTPE